MNITVIGTGYVGLVTGTIFAHLGNSVYCVDINKQKIADLKKNISPIYEPGLEELIAQNQKEGRLHFLTDLRDCVKKSEVIFIAVGTPSCADGSVNLDFVKDAASNIGKALGKLSKSKSVCRIVVNKSTVPIGTGNLVADLIKKEFSGPFEVVSNPEFLREGQAVNDCLNPDRIIIGLSVGASKARKTLDELYSPFDCPKLFTDLNTAEMIKYASNAFLATSISFINSLAELCEKVGADVSEVARGMRLDKRIGKNAFLDAGPGYGGSCFPKDVLGLIDIAKQNKVKLPILEATENINAKAKNAVVKKIKELISHPHSRSVPHLRGEVAPAAHLGGEAPRVAIWGLAFKPNTDDVRDAPVLPVLDYLINKKVEVVAFDPVAEDNIAKKYPTVKFADNPYHAVKNADLLVVMTEWDEFKSIDLEKVKKLMKTPKMIDTRNIYGIDKATALGFEYLNIGNAR